jgi:acid stress chaperone HdeB
MKTLTALVLSVPLFSINAWAGEAKSSAVKIDIAKFTCMDLMAGTDADRDAGFSYFHGYLAGKKNSATLDVNTVAAQTDKIRDYCLSNPKSTVMDAFTKAAK